MNKKNKEKKNIKEKEASKKGILLPALLVFAILASLFFGIFNVTQPEEMSYKDFIKEVEDGKVKSINLRGDGSNMYVYLEGDDQQAYNVPNPKTDEFKEEMLIKGIDVENKAPVGKVATSVLTTLVYLFLFGIIAVFMLRQFSMSGKSKFSVERPKTNFANIAGNKEAKEDMEHLISFLKDSKKYKEIGAKLPKGVILYGPPGTGKTLMAKAVAGESEVPFYYMAGSSFIEMFAGVGAQRARNLFAEAKKNAPSIIFIDEIDAVGTKRGQIKASSEQDQTLNALLSEMDGFDSNDSVIVIAATNRLEDLDPALIRPGRFDRQVAINLPDAKDRKEILEFYFKSKKVNKNVDIEALSKITIGFSGASLEALVNEAAIIAVNDGSEEIREKDIDDAYFKVAMKGNKKKNKNSDKQELELVAYHEAGHALASKLLTDNSVHKVTIIPSTSGAGGVTFLTPKKTSLLSRREILNSVKVLYAGRAAEQILRGSYDEITSGASQDIIQATSYLKSYFGELGMSEELGMLYFQDEKVYMNKAVELSKQLYDETFKLLEENKDKLERIAQALLEKETIVESELDNLIK